MKLQRIDIGGARLIVMTEREFERLAKAAGDLPDFPGSDREGNMPASAFARVSIAREIIGRRRALGLSQQELAEMAGVRQETISRIETGKHTASVPTLEKIDRALTRSKKRSR